MCEEILDPGVRSEYERWYATIGDDDPYDTSDTVGIRSVVKAHFLIADYFYMQGSGMGGLGPRDINLLHSALSRQFVEFRGKKKWSDEFELAATLFYGLIKNHPFHDANKRTALLTVLYHLQSLKKTPSIAKKELEALTVAIAEGELEKRYKAFRRFRDQDDPEVRFIAWFLRRHSRGIDKRFYVVSYKQLDAILRRFDCWLENPDGNTIDVMKSQVRRRGFFTSRHEKVTKRVANVGFPSWGTEVSRKTLNEVRRATGLTVENGVDSEAFYHGVSPLDSLITEYSSPLRRLANK